MLAFPKASSAWHRSMCKLRLDDHLSGTAAAYLALCMAAGLSDGAPRACSMSGFDADDVFGVGELSSPDVVFTDGDPLHFLSFDSVVPQPTRA